MFKKKREVQQPKVGYAYQNYSNEFSIAHVREIYDHIVVYDLYEGNNIKAMNSVRSQYKFEELYDTDDPLTRDFDVLLGPDPIEGGLYQNKSTEHWMAHVRKVVDDLVIYDVWSDHGDRCDIHKMRSKALFKKNYFTHEYICRDFEEVLKSSYINRPAK